MHRGSFSAPKLDFRRLWAIEIKRGLTGRPEKGFYSACQDLKPDRRFVVNAGSGQYPIDAETKAIGVRELAGMLTALANRAP